MKITLSREELSRKTQHIKREVEDVNDEELVLPPALKALLFALEAKRAA